MQWLAGLRRGRHGAGRSTGRRGARLKRRGGGRGRAGGGGRGGRQRGHIDAPCDRSVGVSKAVREEFPEQIIVTNTWNHVSVVVRILVSREVVAGGRYCDNFRPPIILLTLRPAPIWVGVIGGPGELPLDPTVKASVGSPVHALTVLAYQTYALLAFFLVAAFTRPKPVERPLEIVTAEGTEGSC